MMFRSIALFTVTCLLTACSGGSSVVSDASMSSGRASSSSASMPIPPDWKTYENTELGIFFRYPQAVYLSEIQETENPLPPVTTQVTADPQEHVLYLSASFLVKEDKNTQSTTRMPASRELLRARTADLEGWGEMAAIHYAKTVSGSQLQTLLLDLGWEQYDTLFADRAAYEKEVLIERTALEGQPADTISLAIPCPNPGCPITSEYTYLYNTRTETLFWWKWPEGSQRFIATQMTYDQSPGNGDPADDRILGSMEMR